jgi:eukaryotic-like serine/threonine-protein kinase
MAEQPSRDRDNAPAQPPESTLFAGGAQRASPGRPVSEAFSEGVRLLDRYVVRQLLGRGVFGEVYAVVDLTTETEYALKRLPPDFFQADPSSSIRANFQLVSTLTHPHIATTRFLESDPLTRELYVIMDLVRGPTLSEWQERRRVESRSDALPHELALGICEQVAAALDYAHSQPVRDRHGDVKNVGILHRDLKPSNVMLELDRPFRPGVPFVKVVDFGLAAEIQASVQGLSLSDPKQQAGGTPVYRAPEQWEGRTLTPAMDQWSLAVILYELLSGDRPFLASSVHALAVQIREARPERPLQVSDNQWKVLMKAFSPDPLQRYGNCMTMIRAFALADTATSEMLRGKPFVRLVSMRTESSRRAQETQNAGAAGPAAAHPSTQAKAGPHPLIAVRAALAVAVLGVLAGLIIWFVFFR